MALTRPMRTINSAAEFWAPLWQRPARFREIDALLVEGRAVLNGRTARNGLDFARAVSSLGVSRGFSEFERYGFLMRAGDKRISRRRWAVALPPHRWPRGSWPISMQVAGLIVCVG